MSKNISKKVIGIDLGTTNSCVSVIINDKLVILDNIEGSKTTPSIVSFHEGTILIGKAAKKQGSINPKNTIFSSKRFIGKYYDQISSEIRQIFPFEIVKTDNGFVGFKIQDGDKIRVVTPVEVASHLLRAIKEYAEAYLGETVEKAIITVPAYFDNLQRSLTEEAGRSIGLDVLRIINEPTAAILAYGLDRESEKQNVLVYDLGGGTFDVTVLEIDGKIFEIKSTEGDTFLGGDDFNHAIKSTFLKWFEKKYPHLVNRLDKSSPEYDVFADKRVIEAAEETKKELSSNELSTIYIGYFMQDGKNTIHVNDFSLSREAFEKICKPLISKTISIVESAIAKAGLTKSSLRNIFLVGGMTRMPAIVKAVSDYFGKPASRELNPDECVAIGAAVQGSILSEEVTASGARDILLVDIVPLTLGIELFGGEFCPIITRGIPMPTKSIKSFTTVQDNQDRVEIRIFQGERPLATDNKLVQSFVLEIDPAPRGVPNIEVTYEVDKKGLLCATATQDKRSKKIEVTIGKLSDEEIKEIIDTAARYKDIDEKKIEVSKKKSEYSVLETDVIDLSIKITREQNKLSDEIKSEFEKRSLELNELVSNNRKILDALQEASEITTLIDSITKIKEVFGKFHLETVKNSGSSAETNSSTPNINQDQIPEFDQAKMQEEIEKIIKDQEEKTKKQAELDKEKEKEISEENKSENK